MLLFRTVLVITTILMGCCSFVVDTKINNEIGKYYNHINFIVRGRI